jgi:disulfide bond formation protein DsbB
MAALARALNSLALLVVCAVLLFVLYWEFMQGEVPGALGLLQRAALLGVGFGMLLNVRFGSSEAHYGVILASSLLGAWVAGRQMLGYIVTAEGFGAAIFEWHFYTWAFAGFCVTMVFATTLLFMEGQFFEGVRDTRPSSAAQAAGWLFVLVALAHAVSALLQCGFETCIGTHTAIELFHK